MFLTKNLGYEPIDINKYLRVIIGGERIPLNKIAELANYDGLSVLDFEAWFKKGLKNGIIIHFTNKRYNP